MCVGGVEEIREGDATWNEFKAVENSLQDVLIGDEEAMQCIYVPKECSHFIMVRVQIMDEATKSFPMA